MSGVRQGRSMADCSNMHWWLPICAICPIVWRMRRYTQRSAPTFVSWPSGTSLLPYMYAPFARSDSGMVSALSHPSAP